MGWRARFHPSFVGGGTRFHPSFVGGGTRFHPSFVGGGRGFIPRLSVAVEVSSLVCRWSRFHPSFVGGGRGFVPRLSEAALGAAVQVSMTLRFVSPMGSAVSSCFLTTERGFVISINVDGLWLIKMSTSFKRLG